MELCCLIEATKGDEMGLVGGCVDGGGKRECGDDGWCKSSFDRCPARTSSHVILTITYAQF
jgi:hypothetical protein